MRSPFRSRPCRLAGAALLFSGSLFLGCKKPESDIGLDLLDPADGLGTNVVDTTQLMAWTIEPSPVRTSGLSRNILGTYLDPDFGLVTAGIVAQVRLSANNVGGGIPDTSMLVCDSLVLSLAYDANTYGYGSLDPQSFRVFRVNEALSIDSAYTTEHVPTVFPQDLLASGRTEFPIQPFTQPYIGGDPLAPQLRLPLDPALGEEFLDRFGTDDLANSDQFLTWFNGLMIVPAEEATTPFQKAALYFNLLSLNSRLTLYYRDTTVPGSEDTLSYDFVFNTTSVRYTTAHFAHSLAPQPGLPLALADSSQGQQRVYVQALGGVRGELRFPHLMNYATNGAGAVAKAELVLPVDPGFNSLYAPPTQLFVFRKDTDGNDVALPDQLLSASLIGGTYDAANREYRFVITRWVQGVLNGEYPNTGLSIVPGSNGVAVHRAILWGPEHSVDPMRLRLTFTTY
jgi:hypothetical protein